jgi:glycosyltransferase involved in cell wall biosynthesis
MPVPELSLVVPLFNEEQGLGAFFARLLPVVERVTADYEIVCVDDGSEDRTGELLTALHRANPRVKLLRLSRNFGKERALTAGLDHAQGRAVIPIDADLQDPPELIPELVARWREGFDVVLAVRADRQCDALAKRLTARLFYRVMGRMADVPIPADAGDFRLLDRRVVDALKLLPERTRFMKGLFAWLGFRQARVAYRRAPRVAGASRWPYWRLWNLALEGLFSFSTLPLRVWTYAGLLVTLGALLFAAAIVGRTLIAGVDVPGYASLVVLVSLFGGINMIGLGIMGEYLGRVFTEVKGRPNYLVRDRLGFDQPRPLEASLPQALIARARAERARSA